MGLRVLVMAEDFVKDEQVLLPLVEAMMKALGKPKAKVIVCKDPRFHGTSEALKWEWVKQALDRYQGMFNLCLLCVDRDGIASRRGALDGLEEKAAGVVGLGRKFLAENAWQELEVWLLAGHDLPNDWEWKTIREDPHPKERFYLPFARQGGVIDQPAQGRGKLARESALRYDRIYQRCPEDIQNLHTRIQKWLADSSS